MTDEELKIFIGKLKSKDTEEDATFAIHQYGGGPEESYIKANKSGLKLYAAELLHASMKVDEVLNHAEKQIIPLDSRAEWIDDTTVTSIDYVAPVAGTRKKPIEIKKSGSFKDKLVGFGCIFIVFIFALFIIGSVILGAEPLIRRVF